MATSLDDYSTFQYMLARPSTARKATSSITSFVMYNEPRDEHKSEWSHSILARGDIGVFNYYICCLMVLPSHLLGMSKWISAQDLSSKALKSGDELRRFRYSYYNGFLNVDTRHLCVNDRNDNHERNHHDEQFRLVEYMDCPISVWTISHAMFLLVSSLTAYIIQKSGLFFIDTSLSSAAAIILVLFHTVLAVGTGVNLLF